mmetsp:Transcript_3463/g.6117  ORF Transcript_3463/g.6117 Transcript_3463/m.6117 type:complete len:383 (+) Transcript_3463:32-1180(+)
MMMFRLRGRAQQYLLLGLTTVAAVSAIAMVVFAGRTSPEDEEKRRYCEKLKEHEQDIVQMLKQKALFHQTREGSTSRHAFIQITIKLRRFSFPPRQRSIGPSPLDGQWLQFGVAYFDENLDSRMEILRFVEINERGGDSIDEEMGSRAIATTNVLQKAVAEIKGLLSECHFAGLKIAAIHVGNGLMPLVDKGHHLTLDPRGLGTFVSVEPDLWREYYNAKYPSSPYHYTRPEWTLVDGLLPQSTPRFVYTRDIHHTDMQDFRPPVNTGEAQQHLQGAWRGDRHPSPDGNNNQQGADAPAPQVEAPAQQPQGEEVVLQGFREQIDNLQQILNHIRTQIELRDELLARRQNQRRAGGQQMGQFNPFSGSTGIQPYYRKPPPASE